MQVNDEEKPYITTEQIKEIKKKLKESEASELQTAWSKFWSNSIKYPDTVNFKKYSTLEEGKPPGVSQQFYGYSIVDQISQHPHVGCIKCVEEAEANINQLIIWFLENKNFQSEQDRAKALATKFKVTLREPNAE